MVSTSYGVGIIFPFFFYIFHFFVNTIEKANNQPRDKCYIFKLFFFSIKFNKNVI